MRKAWQVCAVSHTHQHTHKHTHTHTNAKQHNKSEKKQNWMAQLYHIHLALITLTSGYLIGWGCGEAGSCGQLGWVTRPKENWSKGQCECPPHQHLEGPTEWPATQSQPACITRYQCMRTCLFQDQSLISSPNFPLLPFATHCVKIHIPYAVGL